MSQQSKVESPTWVYAGARSPAPDYYFTTGKIRGVILSRSEAQTKNLVWSDLVMRFFGLRPQNDKPVKIRVMGYDPGFTLLEVLVASAILSLVLAALYGVFSQTLASKRVAEERAAQARAARIVLLRIGEDLQSALPPTNNRMRFLGERRLTRELPEDALSFVTLTRTAHSSHVPEGDLSEVTYGLEPDPTEVTRKQLIRRVRSTLVPQSNVGDESMPLLPNVRGLHFRFFDGRGWQEEWRQEELQIQLPQAVEATVYVADSQGEISPYSTVITLPLADKRGRKFS